MAEYSVLLKGQKNMKATLKRVFGGAFSHDGVTEDKAIFVKQKVMYAANNAKFGNRPRTSQTKNCNTTITQIH